MADRAVRAVSAKLAISLRAKRAMSPSHPSPSQENQAVPSPGTAAAVYLSGFLTLSVVLMMGVTVPLWTVALRLSAFPTGLVMGAQALTPMLFAIHMGTLMDRLGVRRMMIFLAIGAVVLPLLYPLLPWFWPLVALQLATGITVQVTWVGAQTLIGRLVPGNRRYYGRFGAAANLGMLVGPLLSGISWSMWGPWGAFGLMSLWAMPLLVTALLLPAEGELPNAGRDPVNSAASSRLSLSSLLPDMRSYAAGFSLLGRPAIALAVLSTFLRIAASSIRSSFYPVYLRHAGFSGSLIGLLIASGSLWGSFGALLTERLVEAAGSMRRALMVTVATAIAAMMVTPLMPGFAALFAAMAVFGAAMGLNQPILLAILSSSVSFEEQGLSVGLRISANMASTLTVPPLMGLIIELAGVRMGFYVSGAILLVATALVFLVAE